MPQLANKATNKATNWRGTRWHSVTLGGTRWHSVTLGDTRWHSAAQTTSMILLALTAVKEYNYVLNVDLNVMFLNQLKRLVSWRKGKVKLYIQVNGLIFETSWVLTRVITDMKYLEVLRGPINMLCRSPIYFTRARKTDGHSFIKQFSNYKHSAGWPPRKTSRAYTNSLHQLHYQISLSVLLTYFF